MSHFFSSNALASGYFFFFLDEMTEILLHIDRLMPFYLELWASPNPESPMPLGRWHHPHMCTWMSLYFELSDGSTCLNYALPLLYPAWATCSSLRLDFLQPQLQLHQLPHSCSVLIRGSPSFLALPHPAEGPDHAQKNPDKEHFYSLTILQASSQRVALFPRTFYPLAFSVASNAILHFTTTHCHSATLQNFSCFLGSCLHTCSPFYHKQCLDWITSTRQTGKFLIMPDHRLVLSSWEPGQKIKGWGFISTNLREMYRWTGQFLFIDWNPWSHLDRFKLTVSVTKGFSIILSMHNSILVGKNEFPYFLVVWIRVLDNPLTVCVLISPTKLLR